MTPEERAYRNLWMRELGAPVPEWHQTKDEADDARRRNEWLAERAVQACETAGQPGSMGVEVKRVRGAANPSDPTPHPVQAEGGSGEHHATPA